MTDWLAALEARAPDVAAVYRGTDDGRFVALRREVRRRAGTGTVEGLVVQLGAVADAIVGLVGALPEPAFALPGGEGDWTVAECVGHTVAARVGLTMAAALAASGRWPADAPPVVPGIPGPVVDRISLIEKITRSQRLIVRSAASIEGHETDPCPLDHPLVGRLRCGEWLLFAGVHDLMHLEQLHRLAAKLEAGA
ncbi:MAG: DinB family protein [Chloroflexota bacterium]